MPTAGTTSADFSFPLIGIDANRTHLTVTGAAPWEAEGVAAAEEAVVRSRTGGQQSGGLLGSDLAEAQWGNAWAGVGQGGAQGADGWLLRSPNQAGLRSGLAQVSYYQFLQLYVLLIKL